MSEQIEHMLIDIITEFSYLNWLSKVAEHNHDFIQFEACCACKELLAKPYGFWLDKLIYAKEHEWEELQEKISTES